MHGFGADWRFEPCNASTPLLPSAEILARHSYAPTSIAAGLDVVAVSHRQDHASPALALSVYAHPFWDRDQEAGVATDGSFDENAR
jgi:hypothetical protein